MLEDLYLRYTFEDHNTIKQVVESHNRHPEARKGQLRLAKTLIEMITGDKQLADQIANYKEYFHLNFDEMVS